MEMLLFYAYRNRQFQKSIRSHMNALPISSFPPPLKKHKKMLGNSTVNSKRYAVVIAFGKAHDSGYTSTVNCMKIALKEAEGIRVCGMPFRLVNSSGFYI